MQSSSSKAFLSAPSEPEKASLTPSNASSNPFMQSNPISNPLGQSKPAGLITPSQVLSSGPKLSSNPLSTPSVQSATPTSNKSPFRFDRPAQATPSNPLNPATSANPLNTSQASKPFITPSEVTSGKRPGIFDPLQSKPEPSKVETKVVTSSFKANSPISTNEIKKEPKTPEENKEEVKEKKILARSENSFVEKCNTALLLLLEQSDE